MNRVFRIVWSSARRIWIVASEFASQSGCGGIDSAPRSRAAVRARERQFRISGLRLAIASALLALAAPAGAADQYWDVNGNAAGLGGSGTWNLSNLFWNSSSTGTGGTLTAWSNAALDDAFFGGTAGTITLSVPITAHNLRFQVGNYTLSGGTLTLAGAAPTIYMATATTVNSSLAGTSGVTFNGQGSTSNYLFLGGTNTITGGITLTNGAYLVATGSNSLNGASNIVTVNPGTILRIDHSNAFGGDTAAARLVLSGGQFRLLRGITTAHDLTLTGGTSTVYEELSGTGTWSGTAVLTANSTLNLGAESTLAVTGNLSDTGANVLSLNTFGGNVRLTGNLSFTGDLTVSGGATWFDGGTHTYTGDTILTGGQLILNSATTRSLFTNFRFQGSTGNLPIVYGTTAVPTITLPLGSADGQISWNGTGGFWALGAGLAGGGSDVTVNLGGASAPLTWGVGGFVPDGQWLLLGTSETGGNARQIDFQNPIDFNGAVRTVRVDNGSIADHALLSGQLTGTGGLQIVSDGALELTNTSNDYSGATVVGNAANASWGNLILNAPGSLSPNSNLQLNGVGVGNLVQHGGYVLLNASSGSFTRAVGTGAGQVQWTASGGFGAIGAPQTVNLGGAGATLAWGSGGFVPTGHALRFGGNWANSTINWQNGIDLGAANRVINVNEGQGAGHVSTSDLEVNLNGVIQGTGGLVLNGAGDLSLSALNTYSGTTWIGGTSVAGDGDGKWVWANSLANTGVASSLGAGSTVVFGSHNGGLIYTGAATSTDRTLALNRTATAVHYLFNRGSGPLNWTGNVTTTGSGNNYLRLGGTYTTSDGNGDGIADAPSVISGVISNGTGITNIQGSTAANCAGGNIWRLTGANTFTGNVNPLGCVIEVTTIGNAGVASAVGAGNLVADYIGGDGTLRYIGSGATSDRSFWAWSNSNLESSGTGALDLTNTAIVVSQNGNFTHTLGGTNTGNNRLAATLVDSPTPVEFASSWFRLVKEGPGLWALTADSNARPNAYTGMTRIFGGALRLDNAGAITGGLGVTSSHGTVGSSQRSSVIRFEGAADGSAGVLGLTAASGGFSRGLTTTGGDGIVDYNGTRVGVDPDGIGPLPAYGIEALDDDIYIQGVRWITSGGFAAWDGTQTVNLFGDAREVAWNGGGFVPTNHNLVFGYSTANGTVDFRNGINFGTAARTVEVRDGLAARDAVMSGILRSTSALGGLTKTGAGTLTLTANNTYTGVTTVSAGTLEIGDGGTTGTLGSGTQAVVAAGATLVANRSNAYTLNQNVNGDGTLVQRGTGTTTMTVNSDIDHVVLEHGRLVTPGSLFTNDVTFSNDGGATLQVTGVLRTAASTATLVTGGTGGDTVQVGTGASVLANGSLGDGSDTLDVAGTLNTGAGTLDLAIGDDTFIVHDNTNVIGTVIGGAGTDTLNTDIATTANLDVVQSFETLTKTGAGTLNVDGPGTSDFSTINVNAGTLNVAVGADVSAAVGGTLTATVAIGATLSVAGAFGCGTGNDRLTIAGNVTGTGTIDQCGGDDLLTLQDGANVGGYAGVLDGGAHVGAAGDTVQLDIATNLDFAQGTVTNYESLLKSNVGTATLSGAHTYSAGTAISGGTLDVDGSLTTPTIAFTNTTGAATLNVDGTAQASGATQTAITGSAAANVVNVNAGGTLLASGDLGGGADVLDVVGTLNTGIGVFALADGDDDFVIHDGTSLIGTVDGGAGFDSLNANIAGLADLGAVSTFEELIKSGVGTLNINGPAPSDFVAVDVQAGTLDIAATGSLNDIQTATVASGATLIVDGTLSFTSGTDLFTVAGEVSGLSTIDMLDGADTLTIRDGADLGGLATSISGGAGTDTLNADIAGSATLGGAVDFETLIKTNVGTFDILGAAPSQFDTVLVQGGTLHVGAGAVVDPQTTVVAAGATMTVDGTYSGTPGDDTFTVSGAVDGTGMIGLLAGDDVLTINDGGVISGLTNPLDGGAHTPAGDTVVLNFASDRAFAFEDIINFESLVKQSGGTVTLTGSAAFSGGVNVQGGAMTVTGALQAPTVSLADNTALNVNGSLEAGGGTASTITGTAGINTVTVGTGGTLLASGDLGAGADTLDVLGLLDVNGGAFLLGDGDDNFVVHDNTVVAGTVDGGAGFDTRTYDINASATVGALVNFEGVTKTGTGVLTITGPGATELGAVDVLGGTLNIGLSGSVVAPAGNTLDSVIAAGATLHVDGSYGCGAGNDTLNVSGTVSGGGTIDLCGGEDTLTLNDGAVLATVVSGGAHGSGDTVALNNANALSFDASVTINFETLTKQNTGTATLVGTQSWNQVNVDGGTLAVSGTLFTPDIALADATVLSVATGGVVDASAAPGDAAVISGSAGANTVTVATGATLRASGDLGDGVDVLDVAGALDTDGGVFALGAGNDMFVVHDTTSVSGTVDGGLGNDLLNVTISSGNTVPLGSMLGFESLGKSGLGTLQINGPSTFIDVDLMGGLLEVTAGVSVSAQNTMVATGSTLRVDGSYAGTSGNDTMLVAGAITGAGTVALGDGSDSFTIQDGANLAGLTTPVDGGAGIDAFIADLTGNATLGGAVNFETLTKSNTGTLHVDGPALSNFSIVNVNGGTLDIGAAGSIGGVSTTAVASSATLQVNGSYVGTAGNDTMTLSGILAGTGSIDLQDGDDEFTLNTGATVAYTGVVDAAGASADRFVLAGAGTGTFNMGLVGTVFQNFEGFAKEGAGTWRLSGAGDQDWTVSQGTLIGDSASFGGDIANFGTVIFDQPADGTFAGTLSGNGTLVKQNVGTLLMTGTSTFTGNTQLAAGGLQIDGTLLGAMTVAPGGTLSGVGIAGDVSGEEGAFINPGNAATPFGTLTLAGDYAGGATVTINTQLGDSSSSTSRLVIRGSTSGASSPVLVNRASGDGAQTVGDGISILQVDGASPSSSFRLMQPVQAGAFEYLLYQGGTADANDWFLRSQLVDPQSVNPEPPVPAYRPGVAGYVLGPQINFEYGFTALGSLRSRVGDQGRTPGAQKDGPEEDAWMRVHTDEIDAVGKRFQALDLRIDTLQFGTDIFGYEAGQTTMHFGVMASVGESRATFFDPARAIANLPTRAGDARTDVKGAGVYWTGFRTSGGYFDVAAQLLHYRNSYRDSYLATGDQNGWGGTVSAEIGAPFALGSTSWRIEPQLQLAYQRLELDEFQDAVSTVSKVDDDALRARAGIQLFRAPMRWLGMSDASPYLALGAQRDFGNDASASIGSVVAREQIPDTTADVSVGFTGRIRSGLELHLDARYQHSTEGKRDGVRANFGIRMTF